MIHTVHKKRAYKFLRQSKKFPDTSIWKKKIVFFGISFREDCSLSNSEQYPQPYLLVHINSDICRGISCHQLSSTTRQLINVTWQW